ncbi:family 43 glycosylhydrolase [Streptomyces johnsoniae]|uniref:Family 43 glycosylhydrolase n=1 Tax=Streptomyces johnsoniae TaxID=3075532 RepID=A0ABU2S5S7_9ACTN|nr:family 43 glycosylhydrolase [Streptomyces sp. DSM 41886]MDT0444323.1 family 43 glycosylhydrolase [Streptomyces sp. DSM 41886]
MPPTSLALPRERRRHRRAGLLLAVLALLLCGGTAVVPQQAAAAPAVDTDAWYVLVNRNSGKALDVYDLATHDGAEIVQWTRNDGAWQQWQFVDAGDGYYQVRSRHSGKYLDVLDSSTADGAAIVQWADEGRASQQFRLEESAGGAVRLINRNSGKALDVLDFSTEDGGRVVQWPDLDGANQQWQMIELGGGTAGTFTNPIKRNGPDPWLQYHDGYYYLATTTWNSTITMRRSETLSGLASAQDTVLFDLSGMPNGCCNMWAPEFHLLDGPNGPRWYLYYVAGQNVPDFNPTQRLHVLESEGTDPMGPYHFKADLGNDWQLDPSILTVDGELYLLGSIHDGTQSLSITPLSNPWTLGGQRRTISSPTLPWEQQSGAVNEGAEALYHDGRIMIVYSASACWGPDYKLGLLTLTGSDPLNRDHWTKHPDPVFERDDAAGVFAPGHNGFFTSPDGTEDWIVYHANDSAGGGCDMNRSTRAQRFTWNDDGTPDFGTPVPTGVELPAPSGE